MQNENASQLKNQQASDGFSKSKFLFLKI